VVRGFFNKHIVLLSSLVAVAILISFHFYNQIPPDVGDGLSHYFIVNEVWQQPIFLFDHWGKPLFSLFASPFAYFGFFTYIFFNLLVFFLTVLIGQRILVFLKIGVWPQCFYPFVLISITDYSTNILGGLTEPFFGLLFVLSIWFFLQHYFLLFAILISFLPFARSEGQFVVVLAVFLLIAVKQWKYLPFLGVGFLLYAIVGTFVLHDFLWYFHNDPYQGARSIYGHGNWNHYLLNWKAHLGQGGLLLLFGSVIAIVVRLIKKQKIERDTRLVFLFIAVVYFGIIAVHGYLWATGLKGAFGLSRLATHGLPAILIVYLFFTYELIKKWNFLIKFALCTFYVILLVVLIQKLPFPNRPSSFDYQLQRCAKQLKGKATKLGKIYFYSPLFAEELGVNQKTNNKRAVQTVFSQVRKQISELKFGDLIVWDSHFGPMEMGLPMDSLNQNMDQLKLINSFISPENEKDRVLVFQKI
jgi:hypothetical protein